MPFTGVRPGEKLFEELSSVEEAADKTRHPHFFIGRIPPHDTLVVERGLSALASAVATDDADRMRQAIASLVPECQFAGRPAASAEAQVAERAVASRVA